MPVTCHTEPAITQVEPVALPRTLLRLSSCEGGVLRAEVALPAGADLTTPGFDLPIQTMGQWWVYKRYADQTGQRTNITPGSSHYGIVFQDSGARRSLAVYGARAG